MNDDLLQKLAAGVRARRKALGFTLDELAARSGVAKSTLSKIENAATDTCLTTIKKLAIALRMNIHINSAPNSMNFHIPLKLS